MTSPRRADDHAAGRRRVPRAELEVLQNQIAAAYLPDVAGDRPGSGADAANEHRARGSAGRERPSFADPMRRGSDRDLETRHDAGIERAQYANRRIAQREFGLPNRQQDVERVGKAVMHRVGAARDPEGACLVSTRLRCSRKSGDGHNSMPRLRNPVRRFQ